MRRTTIMILLVSVIVASCGGGTDDGGVASLSTTEGVPTTIAGELLDGEQALLEFSRCMRDQGVDFPDPVVDSDGYPQFEFEDPESVDRDALFEAGEACRDLLEGVVLGLPDFDAAEFSDTFLEYAQCMREHGFADMPDRLDLAGLMQGGDLPFDPTDPAFLAADEQCREIFAEFRPGGG